MNIVLNLLDKYKTIPIQAKASIWYTICNILQKGISFIIIPIYTRILTTAEYGEYSVFMSWCSILIIFATLNLYCGIFTKAMVDYNDDRDRYISSMQGLSTVNTVLFFCVYLIFHDFWNSIFGLDTITMILMFVFFVFYPAFSFWTVRQKVENKYRCMVIVTMIVSVAIPIVSICLLFFTDLRAKAIIWGYLVTQIFAGVFFYILHFIKCRIFYVKKYWIHGLKFNIPLIPHYLSLIILGQADRIMIKEYCGNDKAGIYNLAYQVSMIMNIFVAAINNTLVPWVYEKLKLRTFKGIKSISNHLCVIVGGMTIFFVLIAPEMIYILGSQAYMEAIWIVPAVAISVYFSFCYGLFVNIEFYFDATKYVMIASVIGAVLNIGLNMFFIPEFGFVAAGYTTLLCYMVFMIMHFIFMRKICKMELSGELVFDISFIFVSCLLLCFIGAISLILYNYQIIRYIMIIAVIISGIVFRKRIMNSILLLRKGED